MGQGAHGRVLKNVCHAKVHVAVPIDAADNLNGLQTVPTHVEQGLVDADVLTAEDVRPNACHSFLSGRRWHVGGDRLRSDNRPGLQPASINLATGKPGEFGQQPDDMGHGMSRQPVGQLAGDRRFVETGPRVRDDVRTQERIAVGLRTRHDDGVLDFGDVGQARLDLAKFDSEAAHFHLVVAATKKQQRPVGAITSDVAGQVQASAGVSEGICSERLLCAGGIKEIATPHADARDGNLPFHPDAT